MPELPEVETVRRTLEPLVKNKKIVGVTVWYEKIIVGNKQNFCKSLVGKTIKKIDRYGKYLLIRLNDNLTIVSHLRMEGKYRLVSDKDLPKEKHDHLQFEFNDGSALRYNDVRKFGRMQLTETGTEEIVTGIKNLGPEPNTTEFSLDYFKRALSNRRKNIKTLLLDQSVVAGLGNIYVDEVLWKSKIHPLSSANALSEEAVQSLYDNINQTIAEAINLRGTTVHTFLAADGLAGGYQNKLQVYGHQGRACSRCGNIFKKIKVSGRGTVFCPNCQKVY